jgi:hypothetical protein
MPKKKKERSWQFPIIIIKKQQEVAISEKGRKRKGGRPFPKRAQKEKEVAISNLDAIVRFELGQIEPARARGIQGPVTRLGH